MHLAATHEMSSSPAEKAAARLLAGCADQRAPFQRFASGGVGVDRDWA
jgi:hypothetical protein